MKIVITGPKCSGKSRIGKLLSQSVALPFFETDEIIEQLFVREKGKALSCRAICSEYGEDFFRDYERRAIKQVAEYDFCTVSTGGSALLNKESREFLRKNSVLVLLHASTSRLLERLFKKDIPAFLNDRNSRDLFAVRASLIVETLKPFADIVIDSSEIDTDETLSALISNLRNIPELSVAKHLNTKTSALIFLGRINSSKFLFSLNEKLVIKLGIARKDFSVPELHGITVRREKLSGSAKSRISFFSVTADKQWIDSVVGVHTHYLLGVGCKKEDVLPLVMAGVLARNILKNAGIKVNATFATGAKKQTKNIRSLSIEISTPTAYKKREREFFFAISMFFLSCVNIKFEFNENVQKLSAAKHVVSFSLNTPTPEEEKMLVEVVNLYCALIILSIIY